MAQTFKTHSLSPLAKSFEANTYSRGGTVTPGTYYNGSTTQIGEAASAIRCANDGSATGTLVLEGVDGTNHTFLFVKAGETIRFKHLRVVTSGTTCTNMFWLGGED